MATRKVTAKKTSVSHVEQSQMQPQRSGPSMVLVLLLIAISFFTGFLYFKVQNLEKGGGTAQQLGQQQQQPPVVKVSLDQIKKLFSKGSISYGDSNRKLLFVEISDPSCPYCHVAGGLDSEVIPGDQFKYVSEGGTYTAPVPEMRKLVEQGKASYVLLYANGHGNGTLAMQSLYCSYEKGKMWEAHDLLMTKAGYDLVNDSVKNDKAKIPDLANYLAPAVDSNFLTECLTSGKYASQLEKDQKTALTLGFQGTPHFFINETAFGGAVDYKQMEAAVNEALK